MDVITGRCLRYESTQAVYSYVRLDKGEISQFSTDVACRLWFWPWYSYLVFILFVIDVITLVRAAMQLFPSIKSIKVVEPSIHMNEVNEAMLEGLSSAAYPTLSHKLGFPVTSRREYLTQAHTEAKSDLVIASYSITELTDEASRNSTVRLLWENVARGGVLARIIFVSGSKLL